jgi:hypothetical protein
MVRVKVLNGQ